MLPFSFVGTKEVSPLIDEGLSSALIFFSVIDILFLVYSTVSFVCTKEKIPK